MALIDVGGYEDDDEARRKRVQVPPLAPSAEPPPQDRTASGDGNRGTDAPVNSAPPNERPGSALPNVVEPRLPNVQAPSGVPEDWFRDFIARNPGDEHRAFEAYAPTPANRTQDSQSGFYDTTTHQPIAGTPADPRMAAIASRQNPSFGRPQAQGSFGANPSQTLSYQVPGTQFDDPYTNLLEQIAQNQLGLLQKPQANPALDKLLGFLDSRFTELSSSPGYSPEELAMLRTQALEPLEADRASSQRRSTERIASRGMLNSSGLAELDSRDVDYQYDKLRGAVQRDLGVNAINKRDQDLAQALGLGQLAGVTLPTQQRGEDQQRRAETLALGSLLYDLPRRAMQDNLAVINGSPGANDLFSQAVQLMNANTNQQAVNQQQNGQFWSSLGELFGDMFD